MVTWAFYVLSAMFPYDDVSYLSNCQVEEAGLRASLLNSTTLRWNPVLYDAPRPKCCVVRWNFS
jgi:hypothetical protein